VVYNQHNGPEKLLQNHIFYISPSIINKIPHKNVCKPSIYNWSILL